MSVPFLAKPNKGVFMSTEPEWGYRETEGSYKWIPMLEGQCDDLKDTEFDKSISSFGPDSGVACVVYDGYECQGDSEPIWNPGYAEMGWNGWDNRVSSYACKSCTPLVDQGCY